MGAMKHILNLLIFILLGSASQGASVPHVVVTIKPLHSLVAQIAKGVFVPSLLLDKSSPHGHVLRPSESTAIHHADLVIWIGADLESFLNKPLNKKPNSFPIQQLTNIKKLSLGCGCAHHNHNHSGNHTHSEDPHLWLSPTNAIIIVKAVAAKLMEIDSKHTPTYKKNLEATVIRLQNLKNTVKQRLSGAMHPPYIVFHDAYQYFIEEFDLPPAVVMTTNPEIPLSAHKIHQLRLFIKNENARCIFKEPQFQNHTIAPLTRNNSLHVGNLDPIGYTIPAGPEAYEILLINLAETFAQCASGTNRP